MSIRSRAKQKLREAAAGSKRPINSPSPLAIADGSHMIVDRQTLESGLTFPARNGGTNIGAMVAALAASNSGETVLVVGDHRKMNEHELIEAVNKATSIDEIDAVAAQLEKQTRRI